jgi:uncharacterized protein YuzE
VRRVRFIPHAETALLERGIERDWIIDTMLNPERLEEDPACPGRKRAFRRIPEFGKSLAACGVRHSAGRAAGDYGFLRSPRREAEMKLHYDSEADALYVRFSDQKILESEEVRPGLILDFDEEGRIVAIEMLDVRKQMPPGAIVNLQAAE